MGLQINKTFNTGVIAPKCYTIISNIRYTKMSSVSSELNGPEITLSFYFNKNVKDNDSSNYLEKKTYILPSFEKETRKSQYDYLKTLGEFSIAADV